MLMETAGSGCWS